MKSKNELIEIDIKNRMCFYFDDIINGTKINFSNILLDKKLLENISIYNISYKTLIGPKPLRIRFDKIDRFIIALDRKNKHLILFDYGLQIVLFIILERSELIHIILYLLERY